MSINELPELGVEEFADIAYNDHHTYVVLDEGIVSDSRWGDYVEVVFTRLGGDMPNHSAEFARTDAMHPKWAFEYFKGATENQEDEFDSCEVYEVQGIETVTIKWEKI